MKISKATARGARSYQEDRYFVFPTVIGTYLGVFDGHGGDECAAYCVKAMRIILTHEPASGLQDAVAKLSRETRTMRAGSTASLVFIPKDESRVDVAVLGDSPVLVSRPDGSIWVSPEHNVRTNEAEADAAIKRGGFLAQGYLFADYSGDGLQMSRALGDAHLDKVLSREPEVFSLALYKGKFVLMCSDGAVDPSHAAAKASIDSIVALVEAGGDAQEIVERALAAKTGDNVTAILVRL
jgi:serine/threonine protein phosphatase PrpC